MGDLVGGGARFRRWHVNGKAGRRARQVLAPWRSPGYRAAGWVRRDGGRIGLFYAVVLPGLIGLIGLAGDGAGYVRTSQRAENIAAEAARAGGQAIRLSDAIAGGAKAVDPDAAVAAVRHYLTTAGVTDWTVDVSGDGQQLTVTVTVEYDPLMVDVLPGTPPLEATAIVTAELLVG